MRFIKKGESPDFFEKEKAKVGLTSESKWAKFRKPCKPRLTEYLIKEQHGLCAYCECDLTSSVTSTETLRKRHLEHLAPQKRHPELRFSYQNLVVSCEGQFLSDKVIKERESCGHRKLNEYDESWFLNPTTEKEINQFFTFDPQDGSIRPAETNRTADAQKMIDILNLDAPYLKHARLSAKEVLIEHLASIEPDQAMLLLKSELESPREFISFLQGCFA